MLTHGQVLMPELAAASIPAGMLRLIGCSLVTLMFGFLGCALIVWKHTMFASFALWTLDVCVASPLVTEVQSLYDGQVFGDAKAGLENPSSTNVHKNVLQEFAHFLICHDFSVLLGNYIHKFGKNALSQKLENNVC